MNHNVTPLMRNTLARLKDAPQAIITMERREANRTYALLDKRLVRIFRGKARPTKTGIAYLEAHPITPTKDTPRNE